MLFASGMIFDFEFTPTKAGKLVMRVGEPPTIPDLPPPVDMVVNVR